MLTTTSRFRNDFIVSDRKPVGRGGFGVVVRVKNKIDEREYAVKKVRCDCSFLK